MDVLRMLADLRAEHGKINPPSLRSIGRRKAIQE
jgi:hypothetical protein